MEGQWWEWKFPLLWNWVMMLHIMYFRATYERPDKGACSLLIRIALNMWSVFYFSVEHLVVVHKTFTYLNYCSSLYCMIISSQWPSGQQSGWQWWRRLVRRTKCWPAWEILEDGSGGTSSSLDCSAPPPCGTSWSSLSWMPRLLSLRLSSRAGTVQC